jgi:hypothetical protein
VPGLEAGFACNSMVLFSVSQKNHNVKFFVKQNGIFRPAGACPERRRMGR